MTRGDVVHELEHLLERKRALQSQATRGFTERLQALQAWQRARLASTYEDLRRDPRYLPAVEFFLTDIYGSHDFSTRDSELERAWHHLKRALPRAALELLRRAVELDVLSWELDHQMTVCLGERPVTADSYAEAYRHVGAPDARRRQIALTVDIGSRLTRIVARGWIGMVLRTARIPARAAGFATLQDFLERGLAAFQEMGDARPFLDAIQHRESQLMQDLLGEQALSGGNRQARP